MRIVTVLGIHQLAQGAALVGSLLRAHPGTDVTAILVGCEPGQEASIDGATVTCATDPLVADLSMLGSQFDDLSLNRVIAGRVLSLELDEHGEAIFIDPSLTLISGLEPVADELRNAPIVLAERAHDGLEGPAGELHPGFIAIRESPDARALLHSWPTSSATSEIRERDGFRPSDAFEGWFGGLPGQFPVATVIPGSVASVREADGGDGEDPDRAPILFDWGQLNPHEPHGTLTDGLEAGCGLQLHELLRPYLVDIARAQPQYQLKGPFGELPDGTRFDRLLGRLAGAAMAQGALSSPVFEAAGMDEFYSWLNNPATWGDRFGLTRFHEAIWASRSELQDAYPDPGGADAEGYAGWLFAYGQARLGLPGELLPPRPPFLAEASDGPDGEPEGAAKPEAPIPGMEPTAPERGVNVAGFFTSELGLGEAARLLVAGLDRAGIPCLPVQGELAPPSRQQARFQFASPDAAPFPVTIVCINGDGIPVFAEEVGRSFFEDRYTIGLWWWETDQIPGDWHPAFELVDEVWVASDLIREAVEPVSPVPVTKIPLPVDLPARRLPGRDELGLPGGFTFLFVFDYHSTVARKNPQGVIEAFCRAFTPGSGASLVIKSINAGNRPWEHADVLNVADGHPDIHFIDAYVTPEERDGLMAGCDCYVSLHRSEGLGLTPAEAMWFGRPVIATRYGGVLEFMDEGNSWLVPAGSCQVGENAAPYPPDGIWAEPDLDAAAAAMREVFENPTEARLRGERAAAGIRSSHSPAAAGAAMASRLSEIYAMLPEEQRMNIDGIPPLDPHGLPERLASEPEVRGNAITRPLRRLLRRLERPEIERQAGTNRDLLATMEGLDERLRAVAAELGRRQTAAHAESLAAFRGLERSVQDLNVHVAELQHLRAEHRALPVIAEELAFESWAEPGAGTVEGFRTARAGDAGQAGFADAFRGTEERVRELQRCYVELLAGATPVLDVGCGRGEMLDLLAEEGISPIAGVDLDAAMVARAREKGHDVEVGDALAVLAEREDGSLGAIFSAQVIEHVPVLDLERLLELARAKLRPGGLFIAETVNPHCVNALKAFWVDPTHEHPLFPETMLQMARAAGFGSAYVFHPNGTGDVAEDRFTAPAYAIVARNDG